MSSKNVIGKIVNYSGSHENICGLRQSKAHYSKVEVRTNLFFLTPNLVLPDIIILSSLARIKTQERKYNAII